MKLAKEILSVEDRTVNINEVSTYYKVAELGNINGTFMVAVMHEISTNKNGEEENEEK
ncbi:12326_t:CDS:2, partial [Gigaspora margarita]